jgi:hypothetical protein
MARRKRKKPPKKTSPGRSNTGPLAITVAILVAILGSLYLSGENRSWQEYIDAGDREWAEKMYNEALQYAQNKDAKNPLIAKTRAYLKRLEKVKSR